MRRAITRGAHALMALAIVACTQGDQADTPPAEETTPEPALAVPAPRTVLIVPGPDTPGATGELRITENADGSTELNLVISGLTPGEHAWHIHSSACGAELGPIAVPITTVAEMPGIGQPLLVAEDGRSNVFVTIPADRLSQDQIRMGQYSLHVHAGTVTEMGGSVVCAPITP